MIFSYDVSKHHTGGGCCQVPSLGNVVRTFEVASFALDAPGFSLHREAFMSTKNSISGAVKPANRLPTLSDVAKEAGVSRTAAARVLVGTGGDSVRVGKQARIRIQEVGKRMGYTPNRNAQQLRGVASRTMGVIVNTENARVMSERVFAIEQAAAERGYRLLVARVRGGQGQLNDYISDFIGRGVDAIFCLFDLESGRDESLAEAFCSGYRKVVFHGRPAWEGGLAVQIDVASAIHAAVDHLLERGKRRPVLALWNAQRDEMMGIRRRAFEEALRVHGFAMSPGQIWDAASPATTPDAALVDRGLEAMLEKGGADAILASNDVWAVRFIQALKARGIKVPEDVAVMGFDDIDIACVIEPSLSSVDPNYESYGEACLDQLLQVATGNAKGVGAATVMIQPRLVIRNST